jgi:hypothetical protein
MLLLLLLLLLLLFLPHVNECSISTLAISIVYYFAFLVYLFSDYDMEQLLFLSFALSFLHSVRFHMCYVLHSLFFALAILLHSVCAASRLVVA